MYEDGLETEIKIHHGYIIEPGTFDEYLNAEDQDPNAAAHLRAAKETAKPIRVETDVLSRSPSPKSDPKVVQTSTCTRPVRLAEYREIGTDPIQEAINEYAAARGGHILAPDIYMGLRFADKDTQPGSDVVPSTDQSVPDGRQYLNVVDIDDALLNEIVKTPPTSPERPISGSSVSSSMSRGRSLKKRTPKKHSSGKPRKPMSPSRSPVKSLRSVTPRSPETQSPNRKLKSKSPTSRSPGPDPLTVRMLSNDYKYRDTEKRPPDVARATRKKCRTDIIRRLKEMDDQLEAITRVNNAVEQDLQDTKMDMKTLENLTEASYPSAYPPANVAQRSLGRRSPGTKSPSGRSLSSSPVRSAGTPRSHSPVPPLNLDDIVGPKAPAAKDHVSFGAQSNSGTSSKLVDLSISGLSGITDIVADVVEQGGSALQQEIGLTSGQADKIVARARLHAARKLKHGTLTSRETKQIFKLPAGAKSPSHSPQHSPKEKQRLREWMKDKRHEKMAEYREHLDTLRGNELHKYEPKDDTLNLSTSEIKTRNKTREAVTSQMAEECHEKRLHQACDLLAEMVHDKPKTPRSPSPRNKSPKRRSALHQSPSPRQRSPTAHRKSPSPHRSLKTAKFKYGIPRKTARGKSHDREYYRLMEDIGQEATNQAQTGYKEDSYGAPVLSQTRTVVPRQQTRDVHVRIGQKPEFTSPKKLQASKRSYTELVRLQQPSKTRKYTSSSNPKSYVDRLKSMGSATAIRQKPDTLKGAKRDSRSTFVVKNYSDRQQDKKAKVSAVKSPVTSKVKAASSPAVQVQQYIPRRGLPPPKGPRHKPQTYQDTLKQLQPPKTTAVKTGPRPMSPVTAATTKVYTTPQIRSRVRPGPYPAPYVSKTEENEFDDDSVVSPWSVATDVKVLLYDSDNSSSNNNSTDIDLEDYLPRDSHFDVDYANPYMYTDTVSVNDLYSAAAASSSVSGSIMSIIDWDQVENLIADIE